MLREAIDARIVAEEAAAEAISARASAERAAARLAEELTEARERLLRAGGSVGRRPTTVAEHDRGFCLSPSAPSNAGTPGFEPY